MIILYLILLIQNLLLAIIVLLYANIILSNAKNFEKIFFICIFLSFNFKVNLTLVSPFLLYFDPLMISLQIYLIRIHIQNEEKVIIEKINFVLYLNYLILDFVIRYFLYYKKLM